MSKTLTPRERVAAVAVKAKMLGYQGIESVARAYLNGQRHPGARSADYMEEWLRELVETQRD